MSKTSFNQLMAKAGHPPASPLPAFSGAANQTTSRSDKVQTFFYFFSLPESSTKIQSDTFKMRWQKIASYNFNPKELSNIIHKTAKALFEKPDGEILEFLGHPVGLPVWYEVAKPKLGEFNTQELSNSLWALGKLAEKGVSVSADFVQKWCAR